MASDKKPYVKVSAAFYLKDAPRGRAIITREQWVFGEEPAPFNSLAGAIVYHLMRFYVDAMDMSAEEMNEELSALRERLTRIRVGDLRG